MYRLLTVGSVEIEMMEKQISKKKLERLTIHGGDYRRAGERSGAQLTISRLRELLDDDVKNLKRMTGSNQSAAAALALKNGETDNGTADISDQELDLIFDRQKIFPSFSCAPITSASFTSSSSSKTANASSNIDSNSSSKRSKLVVSPTSLSTSSSSSSLSSTTTVEGNDDTVECSEIPLEGAMYDIITVEAGAGVLGSF